MNKFFLKIVIGILVLISCHSLISFASAPLEAYGLNTIAGNSTYLRTSKTIPNASIVFQVTDPMGEITILSTVTNENGVAQNELSNYYTERAGNYLVSTKLEADLLFGNATTFIVYPNEVSLNNSVLTPTDQVVRSYDDDDALISIQLFDDYDNPIEGHLVKLISSADDDSIELYSSSELTDADGQIIFKVFSSDVGTVTYTAYDVTSDVILSSKAKVVYFDNTDYIFSNDIPDDYGYAALGNSSLGVDGFKFDEIPSSIKTGESINFTLSAIDNKDEIVSSYTGKVRFSVTDGSASYVNIPEDYTFTEQDLGEHTFSLALSFQQDGTYKIEAKDTENTAIFGEYDFTVGGGSSDSSGGIKIANPSPGTYSNNIQVISGTAAKGSQLKIFDNDVSIASITADASGVFSYTTGALPDGEHVIYIATVNEVGTIVSASDPITIKIDTAGPEVTQIVLEPSDSVNPGAIVTVKLYTSDDLSQAAIIFNENIYELKKSTEGYYEGSFAAPIEFGDYNLGVVLVDQLGNEVKLENQKKLNVGGVLGEDNSTTLGDVSSLKADPQDHRVTLNWEAPKTLVYKIKNYRVYYGLSPNQLTEAIDTLTDATTWYLPNLKNGVEYYFAVIALDEKGNLSEHFSNIVASTPNPIVENVPPPEVTLGTAGGEALDEMKKDPSQSGPEIIWLVVFSLLGGAFYTIMRKNRVHNE